MKDSKLLVSIRLPPMVQSPSHGKGDDRKEWQQVADVEFHGRRSRGELTANRRQASAIIKKNAQNVNWQRTLSKPSSLTHKPNSGGTTTATAIRLRRLYFMPLILSRHTSQSRPKFIY